MISSEKPLFQTLV